MNSSTALQVRKTQPRRAFPVHRMQGHTGATDVAAGIPVIFLIITYRISERCFACRREGGRGKRLLGIVWPPRAHFLLPEALRVKTDKKEGAREGGGRGGGGEGSRMAGRLVPSTGGSHLLADWTQCVLIVQVVAPSECGAPATRGRGERSGARTLQHAGRAKRRG